MHSPLMFYTSFLCHAVFVNAAHCNITDYELSALRVWVQPNHNIRHVPLFPHTNKIDPKPESLSQAGCSEPKCCDY